EQFRVAITKEPSLLGNQYYQVENAYRQANKSNELLALLDSLDPTRLGNAYALASIAGNLMNDRSTRDGGIRLFRKLWRTFPNNRMNLTNFFYNREFWSLPEVYDYAHDVVIPAAEQRRVMAWQGFDSIVSYMGDGKVDSFISRLLDAAAKQNKTEALRKDVET